MVGVAAACRRRLAGRRFRLVERDGRAGDRDHAFHARLPVARDRAIEDVVAGLAEERPARVGVARRLHAELLEQRLAVFEVERVLAAAVGQRDARDAGLARRRRRA